MLIGITIGLFILSIVFLVASSVFYNHEEFQFFSFSVFIFFDNIVAGIGWCKKD